MWRMKLEKACREKERFHKFDFELTAEHWANLEQKYKSCGKDKQSPINIDTDDVIYREELNEFDMTGYDQNQGVLLLKNNGHTGELRLT